METNAVIDDDPECADLYNKNFDEKNDLSEFVDLKIKQPTFFLYGG